MTTTETQPTTALGRLAAAVRRLHADGWTWHPARGDHICDEYRRDGGYRLEPVMITEEWVAVDLYAGQGRYPLARLGWEPGAVDESALWALLGGLR